MFATLLGAYPESPDPESPDAAVRDVIAELAAAGLEPLTDGHGARDSSTVADGTQIVAAWRLAASSTDRAVKQALLGPYTLARRSGQPRDANVAALAERIHETIAGLAAAGCPMVEIEEPDAIRIGDDGTERRRFSEAHHAMTAGLDGSIHLSLVLTGGNVDAAGAATYFDLPYASYAFDLIAGPENWRLIAAAPGDRGIVCGALDPAEGSSDRPEILVWAAHYAASTGGRGLDRVGLANASSLSGLTRDRARRKVRALAEAARIAAVGSSEELAAAIDPRAIDIRSAALGRYDPEASRAARAGRQPGSGSRDGS